MRVVRQAALDVSLLNAAGRMIRDADSLVVATTDFLATGGDGVLAPVMPAQGFTIGDDGRLARDVVADWLRHRGGHLSESQLLDAPRRRWVPAGGLPMNCGGERGRSR